MSRTEIKQTMVDEWFKPSSPGDALTGKFLKSTLIGDSSVAIFQTGIGIVGVNIHKALEEKVARFTPGNVYEIICLGKQTGKSGLQYFDYSVFELEAETEEERKQFKGQYEKGMYIDSDTVNPAPKDGSEKPPFPDDDPPF